MGEEKKIEGWASLLLDASKSNPVSDVDEAQATRAHFDRIFEERRKKRPSTLEKIPRFYAPRPAPFSLSSMDVDESDSEEAQMAKARSIVRAMARKRFNERQGNAVMDDEELLEMEDALTVTTPSEAIEGVTEQRVVEGGVIRERLDYVDFLRVRGMVSDKALPFLTSSTFMRFPRDHRGHISTPMLLKFVYDSLLKQRTHISLHMYDMEGLGYLKGEDLESYIFDHIMIFEEMEGMPPSFYTFYVLTAVRRFLFFLDPKQTGKIPVEALLRSHVMDEFIELRGDPDLWYGREGNNWFSVANISKIHQEFEELDVDGDGLLSAEELLHFEIPQNVRLTPMVVQNLLQKGKMDYAGFVDLVIVMENRKTRQALRYLWRVLDVEGTGRLTFETIGHFYKDVAGILEEGMIEAPQMAHVKKEIFDMVKPKNPAFITFPDLLSSGVGSTVAIMLVDAGGFLLYEHREDLVNSDDDDELAASISAALPRPSSKARRDIAPSQ